MINYIVSIQIFKFQVTWIILSGIGIGNIGLRRRIGNLVFRTEQAFNSIAPYFSNTLSFIVVIKAFFLIVVLGNDRTIIRQNHPCIIVEWFIRQSKSIPPEYGNLPSCGFQIGIIAFGYAR